MIRSQLACGIAAGLLLSASAPANVIYVDRDAAGAGDGTSWTNAFVDLQSALGGAQAGDELWVASGTYTPGPPGDSISSFALHDGVGVYGGFAGSESLRGQRDWETNATILSGDVGHDDTVDTSPFAPAWPNNVYLNTPNSGHVVVASGVSATTVLDGFRIEKGAYGPAGTPAGDPLLYGSGIYCVAGNPTVMNCAFAGNFAAFGHGGAIYLYDSTASITHCSFDHNLAHQGSGGAIYVGGSSAPTIRDCTFSTNHAVSTYGQTGQGGAIQLDTTQPVTIARCVFDGNVARPFGGGAFETPRGGAISSFCINTDPMTTIRECLFRNNQAAYGGAVFVWNPSTVLNCSFDHNATYSFGGQGGEGAGLCAQWTSITVLNSTIANNTGGESGGICIFEYLPNFPAQANIRNSIIWGNATTAQDVSVRNASVNGPFEADHSCIQHLFTADPGEDPIDPANYPGCTVIDPLLVAPATGNLRLLAASPCIDTGVNAFVPVGTPVDLDGNARIVRGLPGPGANVVDMGAFERQSARPGDANCDGSIDFFDIDPFLLALFEPAGFADLYPECDIGNADCNRDTAIDFFDIDPFLACLFAGTCP